MIRDSPSHIYSSALPLSPSSSWVRECYKAEVVGGVRVLMGLPDQWNACSRTIFLEGQPIAFAHWGDIIAVGIVRNVVLLDAITGIKTSVLYGHTGHIRSLAFSLDGTLLVSGSDDKTVKLWDVQTGGVVRTLGDDTSLVLAVSISPDGATIASGTRDGGIHLWDVRTGKCHSIDTRQGGAVSAVSFSPIDSRRLISLSGYTTIRQWDVDGHQIGDPYREGDDVADLAYTLDGTRFVSCGDTVATVRDSESGALVVKLNAPEETSLLRCCFSPDGRFVACAAGTIILVWDITTPGARLVGRLVGHSNMVSFVISSSPLISAAWDKSVRFWQSSSFLADSVMADHTTSLHGPIPIESVNLFAEEGTVVTSDELGVVKTWELSTGKCKSSFSTPAQGLRDTRLANDTLIIVWCTDEEMEYHIWDVYKGQLLRKFCCTLYVPMGLKISGDGSKIFGLGSGCIEAVSMETGEGAGRVSLEVGKGTSFFVRGSRVGIDRTPSKGWDFGGPEVSDYGEFSDRHRLGLVDWSALSLRPRWIEDTVTKKVVFRLPERYMKSATDVRWDGRYLLVWTPPSEVVIIDFDSVCPR